MKKKLRMVSGNINRALLHLRRLELRCGSEQQRQLVVDSIIALEKFGRTPEGAAFDQRIIRGGRGLPALLLAACAEMKKYLCR